MGHHLEVGQKVLYEDHKQDLTRNQTLQQRRPGPLTVTERIRSTTYQIQDDGGPPIFKLVHKNHLVEYYPREDSLPAMTEEYVPPDHQDDIFYERFMEQRARTLNNPNTTDEHDTFPFPIEPLQSNLSTNKPKRLSAPSNDSGITSPLAFLEILCCHPQFVLKHQPPIHLLHSMHKLLKHCLKDISVRFNNLFAIVLNCLPESPNTFARQHITPVLNQY